MNVDLIIISLMVCIAICVGLTIIFALLDAKKRKNNNTNSDTNSDETNGVADSVTTTVDTIVGEQIDTTETSEEITPVSKSLNPEPVLPGKTEETNTSKLESEQASNRNVESSEKDMNKKSHIPDLTQILTENTDDSRVPVTYTANSLADITLNLLTEIAKELQKKSEATESVIVRYLKDGMQELVKNPYGGFGLSNEEIIANGDFLDDATSWEIPAGSNINIRFCVNIVAPSGYRVFIEPLDDVIDAKGLEVLDIVLPSGDATSIRVRMRVNKDCIIRKQECLFLAKVQKEVLL